MLCSCRDRFARNHYESGPICVQGLHGGEIADDTELRDEHRAVRVPGLFGADDGRGAGERPDYWLQRLRRMPDPSRDDASVRRFQAWQHRRFRRQFWIYFRVWQRQRLRLCRAVLLLQQRAQHIVNRLLHPDESDLCRDHGRDGTPPLCVPELLDADEHRGERRGDGHRQLCVQRLRKAEKSSHAGWRGDDRLVCVPKLHGP